MKKHAAVRRKPARRKPVASPGVFADWSFDLDLVRPPLNEADDDDFGIEDVIEELLLADPGGPDDLPDPETMSLLEAALDGVRVAANGGDMDARLTLIAEARREWKRLKEAGCAPSYWGEGEDGGWGAGALGGHRGHLPVSVPVLPSLVRRVQEGSCYWPFPSLYGPFPSSF